MAGDFKTVSIGAVVFRVKDKSFICSSLSMQLAINQLPMAMVVVGVGNSILGDDRIEKNNDSEYLIAMAHEQAGGGLSTFIDCSIDVVKGEEVHTVFKGIISDISFVYKTDGGTIRAMRITCVHKAAELYTSPLAEYSWASGADMVTEIISNTSKETEPTDAVGQYGMRRLSSLDEHEICKRLEKNISHKDIVTRIAYLAGAIVVYSSHTINRTDPPPEEMKKILHIDDYLSCDYVIDDAAIALNAVTDLNYSLALCRGLQSSIQGGEVFDAITGMITSLDFLLTIVPKMYGDFKLNVRPSMAWDTSVIHEIAFSDVSSINSSYNPLSHINDPEVFIVNYSNAINFGDAGGKDGPVPADMTGVYSPNKQVQEYIRQRYSTDKDVRNAAIAAMNQDFNRYKKRVMRAPYWLNLAYIKRTKSSNGSDSSLIEEQRIQQKEQEGQDPAANVPEGTSKDYKHGRYIADEIAKAIYAMQYGASYRAEVDLSPRLLFGGGGTVLENCIGELVDIVPSDPKDKHLAIRGMINTISFTYNAGKSASCTYNMVISHMRPRDENEKSIVCPLYIKKSDVDPIASLRTAVLEAKQTLAAAGIE